MEKKKISSRIKELALSYSADKIADFDENPLTFLENKLYLIQFIFNVVVTLTLFVFSGFNIAFKYINSNYHFTPSLYVLLFANILSLLLIVVYYIAYKIKRKHEDPNLICETILAIAKFAIKVLKLFIPIMLLITLVGNPAYKLTTMIISMISIFCGFFSFFLGTYKFIHFMLTRKKKLEKKKRNYERYQNFDKFYQDAINNKQQKEGQVDNEHYLDNK